MKRDKRIEKRIMGMTEFWIVNEEEQVWGLKWR
jgi:hypothetical protein